MPEKIYNFDEQPDDNRNLVPEKPGFDEHKEYRKLSRFTPGAIFARWRTGRNVRLFGDYYRKNSPQLSPEELAKFDASNEERKNRMSRQAQEQYADKHPVRRRDVLNTAVVSGVAAVGYLLQKAITPDLGEIKEREAWKKMAEGLSSILKNKHFLQTRFDRPSGKPSQEFLNDGFFEYNQLPENELRDAVNLVDAELEKYSKPNKQGLFSQAKLVLGRDFALRSHIKPYALKTLDSVEVFAHTPASEFESKRKDGQAQDLLAVKVPNKETYRLAGNLHEAVLLLALMKKNNFVGDVKGYVGNLLDAELKDLVIKASHFLAYPKYSKTQDWWPVYAPKIKQFFADYDIKIINQNILDELENI